VALVVCLSAPVRAQDDNPHLITASEQARFTTPDGLVTVTLVVNPETVDGALGALSYLTAEPGAAVPEHLHETSAEVLYILEGGGQMTVDGVTSDLSAGQAVYVPPNTPHSYVNNGDTTFRAIQVYLPPGPEARFRTWNAVADDDG
jgi:mannose-6-phosphate isomerase-like protein (cupin superfamily)